MILIVGSDLVKFQKKKQILTPLIFNTPNLFCAPIIATSIGKSKKPYQEIWNTAT